MSKKNAPPYLLGEFIEQDFWQTISQNIVLDAQFMEYPDWGVVLEVSVEGDNSETKMAYCYLGIGDTLYVYLKALQKNTKQPILGESVRYFHYGEGYPLYHEAMRGIIPNIKDWRHAHVTITQKMCRFLGGDEKDLEFLTNTLKVNKLLAEECVQKVMFDCSVPKSYLCENLQVTDLGVVAKLVDLDNPGSETKELELDFSGNKMSIEGLDQFHGDVL